MADHVTTPLDQLAESVCAAARIDKMDHLTTPTFTAEELRQIADWIGDSTEADVALFAASLVEENARLRDDLASKQPSVPELRAQLARVQALPERWRKVKNDLSVAQTHPAVAGGMVKLAACADELDAALKGDA